MIWISKDDNFRFFSTLLFSELINVNFIHLFYCITLSIFCIPNEETDEAIFLHYTAYKFLNYLFRAQLHIEEAF